MQWNSGVQQGEIGGDYHDLIPSGEAKSADRANAWIKKKKKCTPRPKNAQVHLGSQREKVVEEVLPWNPGGSAPRSLSFPMT